MRHHDVEEFNCIIERYGLWKHDLIVLGQKVAEQLKLPFELPLPISPQGKVVTISGDDLAKIEGKLS